MRVSSPFRVANGIMATVFIYFQGEARYLPEIVLRYSAGSMLKECVRIRTVLADNKQGEPNL